MSIKTFEFSRKLCCQYALLNECWRLVRDGVVSAQDLDVVMKVTLEQMF